MNYDLIYDLKETIEDNSLEQVRKILSYNGFVEWKGFLDKEGIETWSTPEEISNFYQMIENKQTINRSAMVIVGWQKEPSHFIQVVFDFTSSILPTHLFRGPNGIVRR